MKLINTSIEMSPFPVQHIGSGTVFKHFKAITLTLFCAGLLSACSIFPEKVSDEMQEDPNPQTNNFF